MRHRQPVRPCNRALMAVLVLGAAARAADRPGEVPTAIFTAARTAVAEGNLDRTRLLGSPFVKTPFDENSAEGGVLVGFDVALAPWMGDSEFVQALRPIYMTLNGERSYHEYGKFTEARPRAPNGNGPRPRQLRTVRVTAEPGYAVGALKLRSGMFVDAMALTFMRIRGTRLDPQQSYTSNWVGNTHGGTEVSLSAEGAVAVGVFGHQDEQHVLGLGFILLRAPAPPAAVEKPVKRQAETPAAEKPSKRTTEAPLVEKPAEPPGVEPEAAAVPPAGEASRPRKEPSRDAGEVPWLPFVIFGVLAIPLLVAFLMFVGRTKPPPARAPRRAAPDDDILEVEEVLDVLPADPEPLPDAAAICTKPAPALGPSRRGEPEGPRLDLSLDEPKPRRRVAPPAAPPGRVIRRCIDCRVGIGPRGDGSLPEVCPRCGGPIVRVVT
jgi:hypothetical protein